MLTELTVENYALIDSLSLVPGPSLTTITGETGAGKSILLGALGLLLGSRADGSVIKDTGRNCVVEGVFELSGYGLEGLFTDNDLEYESTTVIRRVISPQGKSRAYVNDLPVGLQFLRELGSSLIDIHSQNQSLRIADEAFRLQVVDGMAQNADLLEQYGKVYTRWKRASADLEKRVEEADKAASEEQWLRHQVEELDAAAFAEGEQQRLEAALDELAHAEEIKRILTQTGDVLGREGDGVLVALKNSSSALGRIGTFFPPAADYAARIESAREELRDLEREITAGADRIESDPAALEKTEERLALMFSLQKKHGACDLAQLLSIHRQYAERLESISTSSENIESLRREIASLEKQARQIAAEITRGRTKAGAAIEKEAAGILASLGMPGAVFRVGIGSADRMKPSGGDEVRFLFSGNAGTAPAPVEKIASGGEMSRVMLALKSIAARSRRMPTIIFDEIDSGVSGKIADAMGEIINSLAEGRQVINITHLPQVAAKGDCHFYVYKDDSGGTSRTAIKRLEGGERVAEIAKMLSGSVVTDAATRQAGSLLGK
ncbi:MAG: DNA repair protein RecN [Rikenellaceae bacterium]|nr:DNA repair protein RecN [Rikenellaceae bacterium]